VPQKYFPEEKWDDLKLLCEQAICKLRLLDIFALQNRYVDFVNPICENFVFAHKERGKNE